MMRQKLSVGLVAAAFTLSLAPAWAQDDRGRPQAERPSNGPATGSAVPRDSGGGSATSSGSSGSTSSSSGSNGSGSGSAAPENSTGWMGGNPTYERAPVRPDRAERAERAEQRRGNGSSSGTSGRAVPRGESGGRTGGDSGSATSSSAGGEAQPAQGRSRAVPTYSRPRDGRPTTGSAVERTSPLPDRSARGGYAYDPYYSYYYDPYYSGSGRYSYWAPFGYGYGLGYFSYDPFLFSGYGYPGAYGGGYNDPYGGGAYGGGGYYGGGGGYSARQGYREEGGLRLKVKPAQAQVHIDGYFVGVVDGFDGAFQKLSVEAGPHKVQLTAEGYEPTQFDVLVIPGETITYKGEMKRR